MTVKQFKIHFMNKTHQNICPLNSNILCLLKHEFANTCRHLLFSTFKLASGAQTSAEASYVEMPKICLINHSPPAVSHEGYRCHFTIAFIIPSSGLRGKEKKRMILLRLTV